MVETVMFSGGGHVFVSKSLLGTEIGKANKAQIEVEKRSFNWFVTS